MRLPLKRCEVVCIIYDKCVEDISWLSYLLSWCINLSLMVIQMNIWFLDLHVWQHVLFLEIYTYIIYIIYVKVLSLSILYAFNVTNVQQLAVSAKHTKVKQQDRCTCRRVGEVSSRNTQSLKFCSSRTEWPSKTVVTRNCCNTLHSPHVAPQVLPSFP